LNFNADEHSMQVALYAPRAFSKMTIDERIRACYQHAVIMYLDSGQKMKNATYIFKSEYFLTSKGAKKCYGQSIFLDELDKRLILQGAN
jgi:hypothetical protein